MFGCQFLLVLIFLVWQGQCAKILIVCPIPTYSHFILGFRLSEELLQRGHHVTMINSFPQKTPIENYRDIPVKETIEFLEAIQERLFNVSEINQFRNVLFLHRLSSKFSEITLENSNVQRLLNSNETFDLVIAEHFFSDAYIGFGHHFKAPVVLYTPGIPSFANYYPVGNPLPSSYVPIVLGTYTKHMTFWQRTHNFLLNQLVELIKNVIYIPEQRRLFKKHFKTDLELDDLMYNASLMLANSHYSINNAIPHVPALIEIAGFHMHPPKKLPQELQQFLDDAHDGVIFFSMGSNLKGKNMQPELRTAILNVFAKIKQKVLWKFETDLPGIPENVKIMKWVPQQDVLAHPNIRGFISHGGFMSSVETVYHGVPVIGIPVFGDQKCNIASAVDNGYAVSIPLVEITEEKLTWALNEILYNPKYRENVKQRSKALTDQPLQPMETAIFWIEYVIRHGGAPHIRSAVLDLQWYQSEMVDVIAFLVLVVFSTLTLFYFFIKRVYKVLRSLFKRDAFLIKQNSHHKAE